MIYDESFFVNKYAFKFYINFFSNFIFISSLFYLNSKLLRTEEEEIKGEESGRP